MANRARFSIRYKSRARHLLSYVYANSADGGSEMKVAAMWDTGCTMSIVSSQLAHILGLQKKGTTVFHGFGGSRRCNKYDLTMRIEQKLPPITIEVGAIDLDDEIDIFIGMDVISMGTMVVVGHENSLDFNFILDK